MWCWMRDKCFISETERGNWTVEVELDCIISTTGEGGGKKKKTVEDKMFTQLRRYRNLTVIRTEESGNDTAEIAYSLRTLKVTRDRTSSGDVTKKCIGLFLLFVFLHMDS